LTARDGSENDAADEYLVLIKEHTAGLDRGMSSILEDMNRYAVVGFCGGDFLVWMGDFRGFRGLQRNI